MRSWHFQFAALSIAMLAATACVSEAADPLRPLRVVQAEGAESQVDESPNLSEPRWAIRHHLGLRTIGVTSGTTRDVVEWPEATDGDGRWSNRLLSQDASVFGHITRDGRNAPQLTLARVADGVPIVKLDSSKLLGELSWPTQLFLSGDAASLWCLADRDQERLVRIDLDPEPRVAASLDLKPARKDAFDLFVSPDEPALVVVATSSPQGGRFRIFDRDLKLLDERRSPAAGACFASNLPQPLALVSFPATSVWQLLARQGQQFKLASQATVGPPRPRWHLGETLLMAGAVSPDGKLLVTSQVGNHPTISVWNPATGRLVREVQLDGGVARLDLPSHHTLHRFTFSASGKYLIATDAGNAYLVDASQLAKTPGASQ